MDNLVQCVCGHSILEHWADVTRRSPCFGDGRGCVCSLGRDAVLDMAIENAQNETVFTRPQNLFREKYRRRA